MSWIDLELARSRFWHNRPYQANIEMTEFRKAIGLLWYLGHGDEQLTAEDLGATIDDCLVEFIWSMLLHLEAGNTTTDYFRWTIGKLQEEYASRHGAQGRQADPCRRHKAVRPFMSRLLQVQ